ncbi:hypothetical protein [Nocardioides litoris]|nr:hypothetical protein [Nocardioides litoris]
MDAGNPLPRRHPMRAIIIIIAVVVIAFLVYKFLLAGRRRV